jgi:hypothetical protein
LLSKQRTVSVSVNLDGAITNDWLVTQERDRVQRLEDIRQLAQEAARERARAEVLEEENRELARKYAIALMNIKEGQEREK